MFSHTPKNMSRNELYAHLHEGLCSRKEAISCGSIPPQQIDTVIRDILRDHPELCHFEGKWRYGEGTVFPQYVLPLSAYQETLSQARELFSGLSRGDLPLNAYIWISEHVSYDLTAEHSQNAYGALIRRCAVCKGIAKAYQLLMRFGGIPCVLAEGTLDGISRHVWNMICLDGRWWHVDVTMSYPLFWHLTGAADPFGGWLRTTEDISRSHAVLSRTDCK